jgi:hypothetical protein
MLKLPWPDDADRWAQMLAASASAPSPMRHIESLLTQPEQPME